MSEYKNPQKPLWRITSRERRFILLIGDSIIAVFALFVALYFWGQQDQWLHFSWEFLRDRPPDWFYLLPFMWLLLLIELYDVRRASRISDVVQGVFAAILVSSVVYLAIFFVSPAPNTLPRLGVAGFIAAAGILTLLWRLLYIKVFTAPVFLRRVLFIGAGRAGSTLAEIVKGLWPPPFFLVGFIDDDSEKIGRKIKEVPVLGGSNDLLKIIKRENISDLIFAITGPMKPALSKAILNSEEQGIEVTTLPVIYEELLGRVPIRLLQDDWILRSFLDESHSSGSYEIFKRLIDIIGSMFGLGLTLLLFPFIALAILVDDGFPISYKQTRNGKSGKIFDLYKFRTMMKDAEKDGVARLAIENDERVTKVGRFLRKSRLDELPQFMNVLKGDISLVGPRAERPQLVNEMQKKIPFYRARLFVKPGATGWAQINYSYASNIEETANKLEYDLYYIKHRSILLDLTIMMRTIGTILRFKGQ